MISVVIPAFNEEQSIGITIAAVQRLPNYGDGWETLVVDDGSTDRTSATASAHGARVIRHPHNLGYGRALKTGIDAASHDTIIIIDADGTYAADDIPGLVEAYADGFDMVVGVRSGKDLREPFLKVVLRAVLTLLVEFTAGRRIPDVNSGLRVFSRKAIQPYFGQLCDTFSFTTSLTLAYMMTARFVNFVPIRYGTRLGQSKVRLLRDALRTLQYVVQAILYYNPIKLFLLTSLSAAAVTLVLAAVALTVSSTTTVLVIAIGSGVSMVLFGLGLVADLLRQIMKK
jgi:glycosyltransferase involved in cell wall biosynthesis